MKLSFISESSDTDHGFSQVFLVAGELEGREKLNILLGRSLII